MHRRPRQTFARQPFADDFSAPRIANPHDEKIVGVPFQMSAFQEHAFELEILQELARGRFTVLTTRQRSMDQDFSFGPVRGEQAAPMDQVSERRVGTLFEQLRAITRGQDRIDHDTCFRERSQGEQDVPGAVVAGEHSDLDCRGLDCIEGRAQLLEQDRGEDGEDPLYAKSILDRECGGDGGPVDREGAKDLEIGLKPGAPRRVGAGN